MSNTLNWRVQGIVRDAKGHNVDYIIYCGETFTVLERISDPKAAREYLQSRSLTAHFGDPNARYGRQARRRQNKVAGKHHGKTIILHQRTVKTLAAAEKLAQGWHDARC